MPCKYASNMEGFLPNSFTSTFSSYDKLDLVKRQLKQVPNYIPQMVIAS